MIRRTLEGEFTITPEEMAKEFWDMGERKQARFFNELAKLSPGPGRMRQFAWVVHKDSGLTKEGKDLMEDIGEAARPCL